MNNTISTAIAGLVKRCIEGDKISQKQLFDLYYRSMYYTCYRYAKDKNDTEDILQDGFIKVFDNLSRFRNEGSFDGWMKRIFITTAISYTRRKKSPTIIESNGMETLIADGRPSGLDNLQHKDILTSSTKLSDGYRTIFHLYAVEGYTHKEIANILGIAESTSKSQFFRARALLRNVIQNRPLSRYAERV